MPERDRRGRNHRGKEQIPGDGTPRIPGYRTLPRFIPGTQSLLGGQGRGGIGKVTQIFRSARESNPGPLGCEPSVLSLHHRAPLGEGGEVKMQKGEERRKKNDEWAKRRRRRRGKEEEVKMDRRTTEEEKSIGRRGEEELNRRCRRGGRRREERREEERRLWRRRGGGGNERG